MLLKKYLFAKAKGIFFYGKNGRIQSYYEMAQRRIENAL